MVLAEDQGVEKKRILCAHALRAYSRVFVLFAVIVAAIILAPVIKAVGKAGILLLLIFIGVGWIGYQFSGSTTAQTVATPIIQTATAPAPQISQKGSADLTSAHDDTVPVPTPSPTPKVELAETNWDEMGKPAPRIESMPNVEGLSDSARLRIMEDYVAALKMQQEQDRQGLNGREHQREQQEIDAGIDTDQEQHNEAQTDEKTNKNAGDHQHLKPIDPQKLRADMDLATAEAFYLTSTTAALEKSISAHGRRKYGNNAPAEQAKTLIELGQILSKGTGVDPALFWKTALIGVKKGVSPEAAGVAMMNQSIKILEAKPSD
jgi:hypothetical protein